MEQIIKLLKDNGITPSEQDLLLIELGFNYGYADGATMAISSVVDKQDEYTNHN